MKKIVISILAVAALALTACQQESRLGLDGELVDVTFQLCQAGPQTKAYSDGTTATTLDVLVYNDRESGKVYLPNLSKTTADAFANGLTAQVVLKLVRGENYEIVFVAHAPNAPYALDGENGTLTVTATGDANDENRDAFIGKFNGVVTGFANDTPVNLTRPFAQINVLTTAEDWTAATSSSVTFSGSSMQIYAPTVMDLHTGEVSDEAAYSFTFAAINSDGVNIPGYTTGYKYIAMNYVLTGETKALVGDNTHPFSFSIYREGQNDAMYEHVIPNIPIQRNYRTILVGDIFCVDAGFQVAIQNAFGDNDHVAPLNSAPQQIAVDNNAVPATVTNFAYNAANLSGTATIPADETLDFAALVGSDSPFAPVYTSSAPAVGTIDDQGLFTAVAAGTTTVNVHYNAVINGVEVKAGENLESADINFVVTVTAVGGNDPVQATITATDKTVEVGKTVDISATTNSSAAITYSSADQSIATVSDAGVITGVTEGSTTITLAVAEVANEFTAATLDITVTVTAAQQAASGITIDGNISDWDAVTTSFDTGKSRIVSWKASSDDDNVYFLYKIAKAEITFNNGSYDWASYIYIGFDTDNNATTGGSGGASLGEGLEAQADIYPWTGDTEGSPEILSGENTKGIGIECPIGTNTGYVAADGEIDGDYCYIEVSVARDKIGSPAGTITVNHSMSWQVTGAQQITLSGEVPQGPVQATITATDKSVEVGKTVDISATTNSTAAITYASGDESIATVSDAGVITGVAEGSTTITLNVAAVGEQFTAAEKTINVTVTAAQQASPSGITIDGDFSDWDSIAQQTSGGTSRIRSWKYTFDDNTLFFYFVLRENKMRTAYKLLVGFDYDDTGAFTDNNNMGGCEILVAFQPFTNEAAGTPVCVNGVITSATINGTETDGISINAYGADPDPSATGDLADYWLEVSIPRSILPNLPAAGSSINIGASYEYYTTGFAALTL